jgi:DNA-binding transcriptional ArsR family regulator
MSARRREPPVRKVAPRDLRHSTPLFAALADPTRLRLLATLSTGPRFSITRLTRGLPLTRQAITKHLRVLEHSGLVRGVRHGRENLFQLHPARLATARETLDRISRQWDVALARLKAYVEE